MDIINNEGTLPLGLCKQAVMKLDAFMADIREISEDEDISPENKLMFTQMCEISGNMMAALLNIVSQEMGEDEFMAETIEMDQIDQYPEDLSDPMDDEIK